MTKHFHVIDCWVSCIFSVYSNDETFSCYRLLSLMYFLCLLKWRNIFMLLTVESHVFSLFTKWRNIFMLLTVESHVFSLFSQMTKHFHVIDCWVSCIFSVYSNDETFSCYWLLSLMYFLCLLNDETFSCYWLLSLMYFLCLLNDETFSCYWLLSLVYFLCLPNDETNSCYWLLSLMYFLCLLNDETFSCYWLLSLMYFLCLLKWRNKFMLLTVESHVFSLFTQMTKHFHVIDCWVSCIFSVYSNDETFSCYRLLSLMYFLCLLNDETFSCYWLLSLMYFLCLPNDETFSCYWLLSLMYFLCLLKWRNIFMLLTVESHVFSLFTQMTKHFHVIDCWVSCIFPVYSNDETFSCYWLLSLMYFLCLLKWQNIFMLLTVESHVFSLFTQMTKHFHGIDCWVSCIFSVYSNDETFSCYWLLSLVYFLCLLKWRNIFMLLTVESHVFSLFTQMTKHFHSIDCWVSCIFSVYSNDKTFSCYWLLSLMYFLCLLKWRNIFMVLTVESHVFSLFTQMTKHFHVIDCWVSCIFSVYSNDETNSCYRLLSLMYFLCLLKWRNKFMLLTVESHVFSLFTQMTKHFHVIDCWVSCIFSVYSNDETFSCYWLLSLMYFLCLPNDETFSWYWLLSLMYFLCLLKWRNIFMLLTVESRVFSLFTQMTKHFHVIDCWVSCIFSVYSNDETFSCYWLLSLMYFLCLPNDETFSWYWLLSLMYFLCLLKWRNIFMVLTVESHVFSLFTQMTKQIHVIDCWVSCIFSVN